MSSGGSLVNDETLSIIQEQGPVLEYNQNQSISLEANQIEMFPNPAADAITLKANNEIQLIQIISTSGKVVMELNSKSYNEEILISDLQSGIYYVMVHINGEMIPQKLVKL